jgi:formiminotetrahydrofolate cyclodeaminase
MTYFEGKFKEYTDDLASNKPAPGGGSAAATVGAFGVGLLSMVANFTVGKKKHADVEEEMQGVLAECEKYRAKLQELIDADVEAYSEVSKAYSMPRETDEQKAEKTKAIQAALKVAMSAPLEVCKTLAEAVKLCEPLLERGNQNLASDVGVGAEFIASGFRSALMNVEINLAFLKDEELVNKTRTEVSAQEKEIQSITESVIKQTKEKIG